MLDKLAYWHIGMIFLAQVAAVFWAAVMSMTDVSWMDGSFLWQPAEIFLRRQLTLLFDWMIIVGFALKGEEF